MTVCPLRLSVALIVSPAERGRESCVRPAGTLTVLELDCEVESVTWPGEEARITANTASSS